MNESIEDMDEGIELKNNKIKFLADKIGTLEEHNIQEMEQVNLIEILVQTDKVMKLFEKIHKKHKQFNF